MLGKTLIAKIYDLADVYHSDNIDRVSDDFIEAAGITPGTFDNIACEKYAVPSHWDMGKVYKRLILGISWEKKLDIIDVLLPTILSSARRLTIITAVFTMTHLRIF